MKPATAICLVCELKKYPIEKLMDDEFFVERKNEFYPKEEFGDFGLVCPDCHEGLVKYYLTK
jgi:hypothetical protein